MPVMRTADWPPIPDEPPFDEPNAALVGQADRTFLIPLVHHAPASPLTTYFPRYTTTTAMPYANAYWESSRPTGRSLKDRAEMGRFGQINCVGITSRPC